MLRFHLSYKHIVKSVVIHKKYQRGYVGIFSFENLFKFVLRFRLSYKHVYSGNALNSFNKCVHSCGSGDEESYQLATHTVKVRRSGTLTDVSVLWDTGDEAVIGSAHVQLESRMKVMRLPSMNSFNKASPDVTTWRLFLVSSGFSTHNLILSKNLL